MSPNSSRTMWMGWTVAIGFLLTTVCGCWQDMADQPRLEPLEPSTFFRDGEASRPAVPGTVARGHLWTDPAFEFGQLDGQAVERIPIAVNAELLDRGQQRFNIFCSQCHDRVGSGLGMVVRRGFPAPPTFHDDRLREVRDGYIFDVISNGFGRMPALSEQIRPQDRWAIVAYVRALQLSQHAQRDQLSPDDLKALNEQP